MSDATIYKPDTIILPRWNVVLHIAVERDRKIQWFPLRSVCAAMGISWPTQMEVVKGTPRLDNATRTIALKTDAGMRQMLCMKRPELSLWIAGVDARRVKEELRGKVEQFQSDLMAAADKLLFPGSAVAPEGQRGLVSHSEREEFTIACLDCGKLHRVVKVDGEIEVLAAD